MMLVNIGVPTTWILHRARMAQWTMVWRVLWLWVLVPMIHIYLPEHTIHSFLCTMHSLQSKCTCEFFAHPSGIDPMTIYDIYLYERTLSYMIKKIWRFQLNNSAFDGYNGWCLRQYLLIYCQLLIIHPHVTRRRWRPTRTLIFHRLSKGYLHANRGKTLNTKVYLRSNFANFSFDFSFCEHQCRKEVCWRTWWF